MNPNRIVISKPQIKDNPTKRIEVTKIDNYYQVTKLTKKQAFHTNYYNNQIVSICVGLIEGIYLQVNAWTQDSEISINITRKGKYSFKRKSFSNSLSQKNINPNRSKHYLLNEGQIIPPLVDMGVLTKDGKIVRTMYKKFKQINRYLEIIDDILRNWSKKSINIIDFGCGKSYLTFIVYYYLTNYIGIKARIIGLDLKQDVIDKCNIAAKKYGYEDLHFILGDINGFDAPFDVDVVMTLHACDTATDYALFNAIRWDTKVIFSVPCCQHELNKQLRTNDLSLLSRYGIIQEKFAALVTDAIRGNLLEYSGYRTQLLEFIEESETPKNILIRAVRRNVISQDYSEKALDEVQKIMKKFHLNPTLYNLLLGTVS